MNRIFKNRYEKQLLQKTVFNLSEVAYYLQCSKNTVHNYVERLDLPKHGGKGTGQNGYYVKKEIDEWVKKNPRLILRW